MTDNDPNPPVAADDFPEFAEPPRHVPKNKAEPKKPDADSDDGQQAEVDDVIARMRRERAEGKR